MTSAPAFHLRDATPTDAPALHALVRGLAEYEHKLAGFTATPADFQRVLFGPRPYAQAILAEAAGQPVGVALYHHTLATFTCKPGYFLEDIFIQESHRGAGLGRALFAELARRLAAEGGDSITWRVLHWNAPSIAFYHRLGAEMATGEWHSMNLSGAALARLASQ